MKKKAKSKRKMSRSATTQQNRKAVEDSKKVRARTVKTKLSGKKSSSKASAARKRKVGRRGVSQLESPWAVERAVKDTRSGDFEGLSRAEQADSESVDELVEEGNVLEAGVVAGVEAADDEDTKEVRTHEILEDDVPEEYLDKD